MHQYRYLVKYGIHPALVRSSLYSTRVSTVYWCSQLCVAAHGMKVCKTPHVGHFVFQLSVKFCPFFFSPGQYSVSLWGRRASEFRGRFLKFQFKTDNSHAYTPLSVLQDVSFSSKSVKFSISRCRWEAIAWPRLNRPSVFSLFFFDRYFPSLLSVWDYLHLQLPGSSFY